MKSLVEQLKEIIEQVDNMTVNSEIYEGNERLLIEDLNKIYRLAQTILFYLTGKFN